MQSEDHQWMDPLFLDLANDLGADAQTSGVNGALHRPPASGASPPDVKSNVSQPPAAPDYYQTLNVAMAGLSQPPLPQLGAEMHLGLASAASLPLTFGSPHDQFSLLGVNNINQIAGFGSLGSNSMLHTPGMLCEQRSCTAAAAAAALARPAGSHSPSSSSGTLGEDYLDQTDQYKCKKPPNKGALAQKRFRERQKEKMRANEAQVADLTSRLHQLQLDKERLESRARLLEQVVSLNLTHEAKLHTNKEIMVREQEMLLDELAQFVVMIGQPAAAAVTAAAAAEASGLQGLFQQQQHQCMGQQQQQQLLQQQHGGSSSVTEVAQSLRTCTVACMTDTIFPHYISRLQQLLHSASTGSGSSSNLAGNTATAAAAAQEVGRLVLRRREMVDRHALFSHYYWAVWCLNKSEMEFNRPQVPPADTWRSIFQQLQLSPDQARAMVAVRRALLAELSHVADEWQKVLPTLALQLLQVPRTQWHTVGAVQSMVSNLAAEREAVVAFLHTIVDEILTPQQEGQLEASSYPWCPDVWAIAAAAAEAVAGITNRSRDMAASGGAARGGRGRKDVVPQQGVRSDGGGAEGLLTEDPLAALAMGTDVLQPLMPFMTAFQLLRTSITARGAGLRLKRALLLDPFKTVVPAAAFIQPSSAEVLTMSLLDAHCGTFQQMMLWDWLKANLPGYLTLPGLNPSDVAVTVGVGPLPSSEGGAGGSGALVGNLGSLGGLVGPVGVC